MKDYVGRVLTKEHLKIAVVGDIDAASLGALLDRTFGGLPAKSNLTPVRRHRGHASRRNANSSRSTYRKPW